MIWLSSLLTAKVAHCSIISQSHRITYQEKNILIRRNVTVRVDALRQSRQRHRRSGLLRTRCQYNVSNFISPSDRRVTVSSRSVGLLL